MTGPAAIDPLYGLPATFALVQTDGDVVAVDVRDESGVVVRTLADGASWADTVVWDGRDDTGAALTPGRYTVHADLEADGASVEAPIDVVRAGVTSGTLGGEDRILPARTPSTRAARSTTRTSTCRASSTAAAARSSTAPTAPRSWRPSPT